MDEEVVEVHRDVDQGEEPLVAEDLEERRQRRQRVARLERRPEPDLVVGEEGHDGREHADGQPEPRPPGHRRARSMYWPGRSSRGKDGAEVSINA